MNPSAGPVESTYKNMWTEKPSNRRSSETAENGQILHGFSHDGLTGRNAENCYTFEAFASVSDEIHTPYYYHYKKNRLGLKEESTWS